MEEKKISVSKKMTLPKEIPCACCDTNVRVIVREAAGGKIQYIGAKCSGCGLYISIAGHSEKSKTSAVKDALKKLRKAWVNTKASIDRIVFENDYDRKKAGELYKEQNQIKVAEKSRWRRR